MLALAGVPFFKVPCKFFFLFFFPLFVSSITGTKYEIGAALNAW
jgi:hypothetical protein